MLSIVRLSLFVALMGTLAGWAAAGDVFSHEKTTVESYGETREFLARRTSIVELTNGEGSRIVVAPSWQGRVMTSTCEGSDGPSLGFVHRACIETGKADRQCNHYGGEDRMSIGPEGGPFGFWFSRGTKQVLKNWQTPTGLNNAVWKVVSPPSDRSVQMTTRWMLKNASGTAFTLDVTREVRLLGPDELQRSFGNWTAGMLNRADVKTVAYETENRVVNRGEPFSKLTGLVSIGVCGMMNAGRRTVMLMPYKAGSASVLGRSAEDQQRCDFDVGRRTISGEGRHSAGAGSQCFGVDRFGRGRVDVGAIHDAGGSDAVRLCRWALGGTAVAAVGGRRGICL
jgi:hypothetical protein